MEKALAVCNDADQLLTSIKYARISSIALFRNALQQMPYDSPVADQVELGKLD
jgi:hypothetical protein